MDAENMNVKNISLKEIALVLLEEYKQSDTAVIEEFAINPEKEKKELEEKYERFKRAIMAADKRRRRSKHD